MSYASRMVELRKQKIAELVKEHAKTSEAVRWYHAFWQTKKSRFINMHLMEIEHVLYFHRKEIERLAFKEDGYY